jgi:hypothetical protein
METNDTQTQTSSPPSWFWIISVIALLWNLMGVMAYIGQAFIDPAALAELPQAERDMIEGTPAWVTAAFALAVWGGALGSLFLLMRKRWAYPVLIISLIGIIVQLIGNFFVLDSMEVYGPGAIAMPLMVLLFGIYLVYFARMSIKRGWIR